MARYKPKNKENIGDAAAEIDAALLVVEQWATALVGELTPGARRRIDEANRETESLLLAAIEDVENERAGEALRRAEVS